MKYLFPVLCLALLGCIHEPAGSLSVAPGTPGPTPQQVSSCKSERTWHNFWTLSATLFGGAAGAEGGIDTAVTNKNAQTGIAIGVAASGLIAAVSAAASGIEADAYTTDNCVTILSQANAVTSPP